MDGIDISPAFVEVARSKNPTGTFHSADMLELELEKRYDVVLCLFSSIGYVKTSARLRRAVERLAAHAREGGLVMVEPWYPPGAITHGKVSVRLAQVGERTVCRMTRSRLEGDVSVLEFEYLVGSPAGIERRSEVHELGLFPAELMMDAMSEAGLDVEHDREWPTGRGLYIGTRRPSAPGQRRNPDARSNPW